MKQNKFYFDHKQAVVIRNMAAKELIGKSWQPFNKEVVDIRIVPNENPTYHLEVIFANGKQITFYEFLENNKVEMAYLVEKILH